MMDEKFANYLFYNEKGWSIKCGDMEWNSTKLIKLMSQTINKWNKNKVIFNQDKYVIVVGFTQIDYLIFVMVASVIGLKIILCDPKMLEILLNNYHLEYEYVISTKKINTYGIKQLIINKNYKSNISQTLKDINNEQAKIIFFTSGTTSIPKLVLYKENTLIKNAIKVSDYLNIESSKTCLVYFPTNYMYGFSMLMCSLVKSASVIFERYTITAREIWEYLVQDKITILPIIKKIVEEMNYLINQNKDAYFKKLIVLNASDRIHEHHVRNLHKVCPTFYNNFGQTESGPRIFTLKISKKELMNIKKFCHNGIVALGKVVDPMIKIEIWNSSKNERCRPYEIGQLKYTTPYAMEGYISKNGNLIKLDKITSGDLVYQDNDGCVFWIGRESEAIKINGNFVNIGMMNTSFKHIEFISNCYFTINSSTNEIYSYFVIKPNFNAPIETYQAVIERNYRKLYPGYPRLKSIQFVSAIPTTISGKIQIGKMITPSIYMNQGG